MNINLHKPEIKLTILH